MYKALKSIIEGELTNDESRSSQGIFGNESTDNSLLMYIALQVYEEQITTAIYRKKSIDGEALYRCDQSRADVLLGGKKHGLIIMMK